MNYFVGLGMSWLEKCPSDKHLGRLAASLTHEQTKTLYIHFDLNNHSPNWENWEYQYNRRNPADMHFKALNNWKENKINATFGELFSCLENVPVNTCVLCEVSVN